MSEWVAIAALVVQTLAGIVAGVWVVASIKSTTSSLQGTINHLSGSVEGLTQTVRAIQEKQNEHDVKIALVQQRVDDWEA